MGNLTCPVAVNAKERAENIALEQGGRQLSYGQLHSMVESVRSAFYKQGIKTGQIVGTVADNSIELVILAIACWRSGFIWAPFSPRWLSADIESQLLRLTPDWLWSPSQYFKEQYPCLELPPLNELLFKSNYILETETVDPEQPIDLLQTSGTSGHAKFVAHSLRNHLTSARASSRIIPVTEEDAWLLSLPLYHIAGVAILYRCFEAAARVVIIDGNEHWLESVHGGKVTHLSLVNAQLFDLLATQHSLPKQLTKVLLGGSAINQDLLEKAKKINLHCYTSYGMTEASSQIYTDDHGLCCSAYSLNSGNTRANQSSAGGFLSCIEASLDDQQQILIKGDSVALGYWQNGRICSFLDDDGWFVTGDTGRLNGDRLKVIGRRDNVFVSYGENLQPEQIERVLLRHSAIKHALVVAIDDSRAGKVPAAFVDWKVNPDERFNNWLKTNVGGLQRPRTIMPWHYVINKNNKVDRKASTIMAQNLITNKLSG